MEKKMNEIQTMMGKLMSECVKYTTSTLKELCEKDKHASERVVILSLLAKTWEKTPLPMGIPHALTILQDYANRHNVFVFHTGELIKVLNMVKGDGNIYTNSNSN